MTAPGLSPSAPLFSPGARVLFQGDSITDGNRGRDADPNHILGHGYVFLIAAEQGAAHAERGVVFINRGVSGDRVADLRARWRPDALALRSDVLSVLVGVNDLGHAIGAGRPLDFEAWERGYDQLLAEARAANPRLRLVLGEPFVLPGVRTMPRWAEWIEGAERLGAITARLAAAHGAALVRYQAVFDAAARRVVPADTWIWDGIHPTYAGHRLMADAWIATWREACGAAA